MDSDRILLSQDFKRKLSAIITELVPKIKAYKGVFPIPVELLDFGVLLFNTQGCPEKLIETFIQKSFPDPKNPNSEPLPNPWDAIKARDEAELIKMGRKMVSDEYSAFQDQGEEVLTFIMKNRKELIGDALEQKLWNETGELIKIAIRYAHLRRHPRPNPEGILQYTSRFVPKLSIKKEAEKWEVKL